jgi:hypothetical protein
LTSTYHGCPRNPALDKLTGLTSLNLNLGISQVQNLPTLDKLTGLTSLAIFLAESQIQSLFALKGLENMKDLRMVVPPRLLASFPDDVKLRAATKLTLDMTRSAAGQLPSVPVSQVRLVPQGR